MEINSHNGLVRIQAHSLTLTGLASQKKKKIINKKITGLIQELQIHFFLNF